MALNTTDVPSPTPLPTESLVPLARWALALLRKTAPRASQMDANGASKSLGSAGAGRPERWAAMGIRLHLSHNRVLASRQAPNLLARKALALLRKNAPSASQTVVSGANRSLGLVGVAARNIGLRLEYAFPCEERDRLCRTDHEELDEWHITRWGEYDW
eukprot:CAMPEP_0113559192 /NCGR_PEP_ID=MMETSP0015_2-20120614/18758_1 /TAXON_ID=2838 /ORGANISM="Odontella" /LENGTH=158 /DNA_ID=CAMNT_0000460797 /DNA_START=113 /DNA_END=594 /DNA_ORIENTATION=- /assembly_acc=CAM_ASM_000160